MKSVSIRSFSGSYFPAFGPKNLRIRALFTQCHLVNFRHFLVSKTCCPINLLHNPSLTHFSPMLPLYPPPKLEKFSFQVFSGGIKWEHKSQMV